MQGKSIHCKYYYKGFWGYDAVCDLEIFKGVDGKVFVVLTELNENTGTSVTNFYEQLATLIYKQYLSAVPKDQIVWVEHYDENSYQNTRDQHESFDIVTLTWNEKLEAYQSPQWRPCDQKTLSAIRIMN